MGFTLLADLQFTKPLHECTGTLLTFDRSGTPNQQACDHTQLTMENLVTGGVDQVVLDPAQLGILWSGPG